MWGTCFLIALSSDNQLLLFERLMEMAIPIRPMNFISMALKFDWLASVQQTSMAHVAKENKSK